MHKILFTIIFCVLINFCFGQNKGYIKLDSSRFNTGDQAEWKDPNYNDKAWKMIRTGEVWQTQGYANYHGYAWYRIQFYLPSSLKNNSRWSDSLRIYLAHVNDVDESYLNGEKIGKIGSFPEDKQGYVSKWPAERSYCLSVNDKAIKWDAENLIAVKVYDGGGTGGIFMGTAYVDMLEKTDGVVIQPGTTSFLPSHEASQQLTIRNNFNIDISGTFDQKIIDASTNNLIQDIKWKLTLIKNTQTIIKIKFPHREGIEMSYKFTEKESGKTVTCKEIAPYILTPAISLKPQINGPRILGVKTGHPILYKIPATGRAPLTYSALDLPKGLFIDKKTGIISGEIGREGKHILFLKVKNKLGFNVEKFIIQVGNTLALTPPMGWNSWNCWGINVSAVKVKSSAGAMIKNGLADYGWAYINVDDGWQDDNRDQNGDIVPNQKFGEMRELGNYLHQRGLKFGIYSSPGMKTCGGFNGSLGHEKQDAASYAKWGVDYLKYDLCSYNDVIGSDTSLIAQQKPYLKMSSELLIQPRDIIYSLCQYGLHDVWKWGKAMKGNSWRTTEDITDTWESMYDIGFKQDTLAKYAGPGAWNDPDMLIVGNVGWGEGLHPTRLNPYEQYTHISLWCMLSAPLLIGCDMSHLDPFTLSLLENPEVIAVDQDELGRQAHKIIDRNNFQVWIKPMADGSRVIGIFNVGAHYSKYELKLNEAGISNPGRVRDLWHRKTLGTGKNRISFKIPPHGVRLIQVTGR